MSNTKIYIFTIWKLFPEFFYSLNVFKGRWADMRRRPGAKHCSSLCSQSEGGEYCGGQTRAKNPTKSCAKALTIFATCSWPSLCEQSELQCWRRNRRLCGPVQTSPLSQLLFFPYPKKQKIPATHMWGHGVAGLFMIVCQYAHSVALATGRAAGCQSAISENSAPEAKSWPFCSLTARKRM